jgi:hypothetical protein
MNPKGMTTIMIEGLGGYWMGFVALEKLPRRCGILKKEKADQGVGCEPGVRPRGPPYPIALPFVSA